MWCLVGQGEPWQAAPHRVFSLLQRTPGYPVHGVQPGNSQSALWMPAGYTERDSNGIRLGPDGEPIAFHG